MLARCRILAVCFVGWWSAPALAEEREKIPAITLPAPLEVYADGGRVITAAAGVVRLLGTAKFDEPEADSSFAKAPCNVPEVLSFYRGMTFVQAAYFTFINKMERGFASVASPHVALASDLTFVETGFGALVKPGRELLLRVWDTEKLRQLLSVISEVRSNPATVNADLGAYFSGLLEFADRYESVKRRAPKELARLNRRTTVLYRYERAQKLEEAKDRGKDALSDADLQFPEHLYYEDYAKEMRLLLDGNRDLGQKLVNPCLDGGHFAAVRLGDNSEITYDPYGLYPTSYMVGFWQRRDFEGATQLVRFAIGRLLSELKK